MVYVMIAQGCEEVEALAVVDILRRGGVPLSMVSINSQRVVEGAHRIKIEVDELIENLDFEDADMIVLPGGLPGSYNLADSEMLAQAIDKQYKKGGMLAAICAAPLVYGRMGLLHGVKATCYPGMENELVGAIYTGALTETDGQFITGKGPAAVFQFAYTLLAALKGEDVAEQVRQGMLYNELMAQ